MFTDGRGYIKKKWMMSIAALTIVIPIVGIVLWSMAFPSSLH